MSIYPLPFWGCGETLRWRLSWECHQTYNCAEPRWVGEIQGPEASAICGVHSEMRVEGLFLLLPLYLLAPRQSARYTGSYK